ncbi:MAG: hypothetical protein ACJAYV_002140 [Oleispira sp.]|jgi:hypothetical protein
MEIIGHYFYALTDVIHLGWLDNQYNLCVMRKNHERS